jgi:WhiB family redox-sensing transcriptional regulator
MSLLTHPASGVVQEVLDGDPPLAGLPPSDPDPALDVARLRARVQDIDGWQHLGACRGIDPVLAVPDVDDVGPKRTAACSRCPVRIDCLAWGVERIEQRGVHGGYPLSDRLNMRSMLLCGWSQR